jgi:hypothetical protein
VTDTLVSLLGLPPIVLPETTVPNCTGLDPNVACISIVQHTGASPFCNAVRPNFALSQTVPTTCMQGSDATHDPTSVLLTGSPPAATATGPGLFCSVGGPGVCLVPGAVCNTTGTCEPCQSENAVYRTNFQDNDPIRRTCFGTGTIAPPTGQNSEDVCSHSGDLGLLLPMADVAEVGDNGSVSDPGRYNATPCHAGSFISATAPEVYDAMTQARWTCARGLLCPNGDKCNNFGGCIVPADVNLNPQCLAAKTNAPANTISSIPVPIVSPRGPFIAEGRAFNQHLYKLVGTAAAYQTNGFSTPLPMDGAFYRIHTNHSMNPGSSSANPITCQKSNMADQIACLVNASPCSIGYAGRSGLASAPLTVGAIKLDAQSPQFNCILNYTYPLARKLYLASVPGFAAVTGNELQLAGCETDLAQQFAPEGQTPAGLVTSNAATNLAMFGFFNLPSTINNGEPYCEDFDEPMLCSTSSPNVNACAGLHSNFSSFPSFNTVCGNGILEPLEACDCGNPTTGGAIPDPTNTNFQDCAGTQNGGTHCSRTCRVQGPFF